MMQRPLICAILVLAVAVGFACDGDDGGGNAGTATGEEELRQTADAAFDAFLEPDVEELYDHFSSDFKDRCDEQDFRRIMGIAAIFLGDVDAEMDITNVEINGERGQVDFEIRSDDPGFETDSNDDFFREWVLEDGEWKAVVEDENPCDLDVGGSDDGDDDDEDDGGDGGPGSSRASAVAPGERVTIGDAEISVISVDLDATLPDDEFAPTPVPDRRYVLATVLVSHAGDGDDSVTVSSSDFKITGSANVVYDAFDEETSCGFLDDEIEGEIFPGGTLDGYVCFQVPEDETDLILIAEPFFAFGEDDDRRFLRLE